MQEFCTKQNKWHQQLCSVCHEIWPTRISASKGVYICTRCKRDHKEPKLYSFDNDMDPGNVPIELQDLTQIEEMLIARSCPIMSIYRKHGGQWGYKGHVVNLPQDVQGFLTSLPSSTSNLPVLVLRKQGADNTHADFRVRRAKVLSALQWLQSNNPCYKEITIDYMSLQLLPEDGIPSNLLTIDEPDETEELHAANIDNFQAERSNHDSHSFLPLPTRQATEVETIQGIFSNGSSTSPIPWPEIGAQPINEFSTPFLATMSFPTLFPHAKGDPCNPGRPRSVSLSESFKHLEKYGEISASNNLPSWRFATHPRFPYWALNMKQRHQLLSQAKVYLQHHPGDARLSIDELRRMVDTCQADQLMRRLQRYASKVQGSSQYWYQRHQELQALLEQKGPPTFFWTVSSADTYWPEMHKLMPHLVGSCTLHSHRVQAVITNPHIADWYFSARLTDFVDHWLYGALDADWHWYRFEYQSRGSPHAHGCAKLKNDEGICSLVQQAACGWLAEMKLKNSENLDHTMQEQLLIAIENGAKAKNNAIRYADWLVTTFNCPIPDDNWSMPNPHPCAVQVNEILDIDLDYQDLVNSVERHTRCSSAYCLRKTRDQEPKCRFDYPRDVQALSTLEFEQLNCGSVRAKLITKRNDPRINSHNRTMLQYWRANVDMQIIVDVEACARYMAKYAAKAEQKSKALDAIFKSCVNSITETGNSHKVLRSAMLRAVGERDFSSQETAHMLLSLPLYSCSYSFVAVSLHESQLIERNEQTGQLALQQSLIQQYADREVAHDLNLCQFVTQYNIQKGKLCRRSTTVIVRFFPKYSPSTDGEHYGSYCKFQLLKYKPWQEQQSNAWDNGPESDKTYISAYNTFLQTETGKNLVPNFATDLAQSSTCICNDENSDNDDDDDVSQQSIVQDDWILLCQLNSRYTASSSQDASDDYDWGQDARDLLPEQIKECVSWIKSHRTASQSDSPRHHQLPPVDISTLNVNQQLAYDTICRHHTQQLSGQNPLPLHMIVYGSAGTGKSYLISAIAHAIGHKCLLTGTTGMASFNICGKTVHSALKLPVRNSNNNDLQGSTLHKLQQEFKDVKYLVIDEMSMIGHRMLAWIDKRLRQATGLLNEPMGGISVILFGDFAQLPPVGDRPLYSLPSSCDLASHGHTIYKIFTTVVILDQILRQSQNDEETNEFRSLLSRLRDGQTTRNDWQLLLKRTPEQATNASDFSDTVRLFYDRESVASYNIDKLHELGPIARINAVHSSSAAAHTSPDDAGGLHPVIFLAHQAQVMLTANLWIEAGLCNGSAGVVHKILYQEGQAPPHLPIAILVDFDNYTGPAFLLNRPKCLPIPPLLAEWTSSGKHHSRQQFPLQLRYAITIHKSQGQTLNKAVIDIGKKEYATGCTYVAFSRLKKLQDGLIKTMPFDRLQAIGRGKNLSDRIHEESRLRNLHANLMDSNHTTL